MNQHPRGIVRALTTLIWATTVTGIHLQPFQRTWVLATLLGEPIAFQRARQGGWTSARRVAREALDISAAPYSAHRRRP